MLDFRAGQSVQLGFTEQFWHWNILSCSQVQTIRQGYLSKRSSNLRGDWKRRFFVLDSRGMLYYYRKQWNRSTVCPSLLYIITKKSSHTIISVPNLIVLSNFILPILCASCFREVTIVPWEVRTHRIMVLDYWVVGFLLIIMAECMMKSLLHAILSTC